MRRALLILAVLTVGACGQDNVKPSFTQEIDTPLVSEPTLGPNWGMPTYAPYSVEPNVTTDKTAKEWAIEALTVNKITDEDFVNGFWDRGTPLDTEGFHGIVWPCDPEDAGKAEGDYEGEQCYAGRVKQGNDWLLETGP
jgi:hypothetical protein